MCLLFHNFFIFSSTDPLLFSNDITVVHPVGADSFQNIPEPSGHLNRHDAVNQGGRGVPNLTASNKPRKRQTIFPPKFNGTPKQNGGINVSRDANSPNGQFPTLYIKPDSKFPTVIVFP